MAGIDDSAGDYGQWTNPQDQSWLDYLKMKGSDVGGGAYNALANITGALSPVGTSPEGNMSLQVPPMVSGLVDSAKRIGQRGGFTRVPEFDDQLKQDLSNVVLSLYGGNALAGLSKPRGALGAGAMREAEAQPIRAYRGARDEANIIPEGGPVWGSSRPDVANTYAEAPVYDTTRTPSVAPLEFDFKNPMEVDAGGNLWHSIPQSIAPEAIADPFRFPDRFRPDLLTTDDLADLAKAKGHDGLIVRNAIDSMAANNAMPMNQPLGTSDIYAAIQRGTVKSPLTGETLFSDNKPSVLGAALATAGEQPKGIVAYHGSPHDFDKFSLDAIGTGEGAQAYGHGLYFADSEGVAKSYRDGLSKRPGSPPANSPPPAPTGNALADQIAALDHMAAMKAQGAYGIESPGHMYEVRINADPESFLDWDKPLSQQSEAVRSALAPIADAKKAEFLKSKQQLLDRRIQDDADMLRLMGIENTTKRAPDDVAELLAEFDRRAAGDLAVDPSATSKLREAGIPGIRYLDGNSRGSGSGSSNYVVFDDSLIEILKKYGIAAGAVGAGALAQPDQASAQDLPDWLKF